MQCSGQFSSVAVILELEEQFAFFLLQFVVVFSFKIKLYLQCFFWFLVHPHTGGKKL